MSALAEPAFLLLLSMVAVAGLVAGLSAWKESENGMLFSVFLVLIFAFQSCTYIRGYQSEEAVEILDKLKDSIVKEKE